MQEYPLSVGQAAAVLDQAPAAIYVSALDNYELLYANRTARDFFLCAPCESAFTCYQAAGFDRPCPYCRTADMDSGSFLVRKFRRSDTGRIYQLSGKLIDWSGRPAHIEYILDVTQAQNEEDASRSLRDNLVATFSSIPCGLCVYRFDGASIFPLFHNPAFYDIMGYDQAHIHSVEQETDFLGVHPEDLEALQRKTREAIASSGTLQHTYRVWNDLLGDYRWIRLDGSVKSQPDGTKLLYGVYTDVSENLRLEKELTEASEAMQDIVNAIPGGVAIYKVSDRFETVYFSDGVPALSGYTTEEYRELVKGDAVEMTYREDTPMVVAKAREVIARRGLATFEFRKQHRDGRLVWVRVQVKWIGEEDGCPLLHCIFHNITDLKEAQLEMDHLVNSIPGGIASYWVEGERFIPTFYSKGLMALSGHSREEFEALVRDDALNVVCEEDRPRVHAAARDALVSGQVLDISYRIRHKNGELIWIRLNGRRIDPPGKSTRFYAVFLDITREIRTQQEKERLQQYFHTVLKYLPGGVAVVRYARDGSMTPEFLSDGFAAMTGMTLEEAWQLYRQDAMNGVHPGDRARVNAEMSAFVDSGESHCEIVYRLKKGGGSYLWVKNTLTMIYSEDGERRIYAGYHDMTREREEQERLRRQYNELIMQHYRTPGLNELIMGHCNITQNRILEIFDRTDSNLLDAFGTEREAFFTGIAGLLTDPDERRTFLDTYLNAPSLAAFARGTSELLLNCFVKLPRDDLGRYVQFKVHLVQAPDTGDLTGILTVTDITEQTISDRILHRLSLSSYDLVVDVDLTRDRYTVLACASGTDDVPAQQGSHSQRISHMLSCQVLPKDRSRAAAMLDPDYLLERLRREGSYSFPYAIRSETGEIASKNLTISAIDLRLDRICLARTDITQSVRDQQGPLNVIAYTFELLAFIQVDTGRLTMYSRRTVLESLPPLVLEDYGSAVERLTEHYVPDGGQAELESYFRLDAVCGRLAQRPSGYDFVMPYRGAGGLRYKQINVLWGDENHKTICMVRADVTDMLAAERRTKDSLKKALALAEEANRAKSDFLSSMSHDIRTPMNAIMGMTALAVAHLDDRNRVEDCLRKISLSSKHLLSLINDILDMSKIERSKITLNRMRIFLPDLVEQLSAIMAPQAKAAGLDFRICTGEIAQPYFYGDALRINQILINILGNAVKFTPEGGQVAFTAEEVPAVDRAGYVRYRFTVRDTGVGMSEEFLSHIFEPFTRNRNAARVEGTGLGLGITKGLVDLMGGTISVESKLHQGSTFRVELEYETASADEYTPPAPASDAPADAAALAGRRFLVAEDNAINAEILCELLQMYGARCDVKIDGGQAVKAFQTAAPGRYDAILMDIQMPVMNGYEATRAIRALSRPDAASIPIIAMTANAFAEDIQASLDAGMSAHVAKPIDIQVLWATLSRLLNGSTER